MSKIEKVKATAKVRITVEISGAGGAWGPGTTIDQVMQQAADSAVGKILQITRATHDVRIVGEPVVTAVLVEEDR